eukprot:94211-Pelagomonas_calceolata.AAC.3
MVVVVVVCPPLHAPEVAPAAPLLETDGRGNGGRVVAVGAVAAPLLKTEGCGNGGRLVAVGAPAAPLGELAEWRRRHGCGGGVRPSCAASSVPRGGDSSCRRVALREGEGPPGRASAREMTCKHSVDHQPKRHVCAHACTCMRVCQSGFIFAPFPQQQQPLRYPP